jgi:MHS family proline/betaine transporter-like MFS transporter
MFESFDFYLFSLFAIQLNYAFFGSVNKHSVLWIFIIFAVGYLARISGALIFGYWGDKQGRVHSFKKTIVVMALSSIAIAFIPSHQHIGVFAIVFLIALRFIQGMSYGGEASGAVIVISEKYKKHQPILIMCICLMGIVGVLLAQGTYTLLSTYMSHESFTQYGWRIAYIFGGLMIFHSYNARKNIAESDEFKNSIKRGEYKNTIKEMFSNYKVVLMLSVLTLTGTQLFWGCFMVYLPSFISLKYVNPDLTAHITAFILTGMIVGYIVGAVLANKTNIKSVFSIGTAWSLCFILPMYFAINSGSVVIVYAFCFMFALLQGVSGVLYLLLLTRRLPVRYRYTLLATAFAFSAFLFIGIPPFIFSYFTRESSMYIPMLVLGTGYFIQLIAVQIFYKKTAIEV